MTPFGFQEAAEKSECVLAAHLCVVFVAIEPSVHTRIIEQRIETPYDAY
ncbi:MAG: hypothetical protein QXJ07_01185 [Candidatus Bathyarchaeia archaeon]